MTLNIETLHHVLFYHDSPTYGGHEAMAIEAIRGCLVNGLQVTVVSVPENEKFFHQLEQLTQVDQPHAPFQLIPWQRSYRSGEAIRQWFAARAKQALRQIIQQQQPDLVVCIQGCLEISSLL